MPILYILTILLLTTTSHQCSPSLYSLNLTTDVIQFSSSESATSGYNFTFRNAFNSRPQVALAITQLATTNQRSLTNPQFYVSSQSVTSRGLQIIRNSQGSAWLISRVCLWASTNTQLLLGSFPIQNSKPTSGTTIINMQFQILIASSLPVNNNQISRGFLNGLNSRGQLATLTIANTAYSEGKITININVKAGEVYIVWVSFVVFNLNNPQFAAYGAYNTFASNTSQVIDLLKGFSDTQNVFYGISALQVNPDFPGLNVQTEIDSNFLLSYTSQMGSFILSYLFVGYPANYTCLACKSTNMNYYLKGKCVKQCEENTVPITLANGGLMCRLCPAGTGLIAINGRCVCPAYYTLQNSKCVPVPNWIPGLIVQSANPLAVKPASQPSGVVNILPNGNINQNMDFTSPPRPTSTVTATPSTFISPNVPQLQPPQVTSLTKTQTTTTYQATTFWIANVTCPLPNTYFNGNECVCNVGYVFSNGKCILGQTNVAIVPISPTIPPNRTQTCQVNAFFNGSACVCINNYYMINGNCIQCPSNSQWNGVTCVCNQGFSSVNGQCINKVICPTNAQDNGLGTCICIKDYIMINNTCQIIRQLCPVNSSLVGGVCVCNSGLYNVSGACLKCPSGALWSSQAQRCVFVCGVNSYYNQTVGSCVCMQGFGRDSSGNCAVCGNKFYLLNGYCATCPINSVYNSTSKQCSCLTGFMITQQGICLSKCGFSQVYNPVSTFCDCAANFSRVGSVCMPCSTNSYYANGQCVSCPANSYFINKRCICNSGYAADLYGQCQNCSSLPNAFMLNGFCVTCSSNQIYNTSLGTCQCPFGKSWNGRICVSSCNIDELLDKTGNCFTCGMNEIISQGKCICRPGFARGPCGKCILSCPTGSFAFMGTCGTCPLNMNYLSQIGGCVCPNGYYMDPIVNVCMVNTLIIPNCANGSYYDTNSQKCQTCATNCITCSSSSVCTACTKGFAIYGTACMAICGDGVILGNEKCDPGSVYQAACTNCQITPGYICTGQPSSCIRDPNYYAIASPSTPNNTNTTITPQGPKLSLKGNISLNSNNIFLTLQTTPTFTFPNPNAMQNFIQATFYNTIRPSTYCVQRASPNLNYFDCLLIYPSGIPNTKFNVLFYFNYQGQAANTTISIDPLLFTTSSRTAQPLPTRFSQ